MFDLLETRRFLESANSPAMSEGCVSVGATCGAGVEEVLAEPGLIAFVFCRLQLNDFLCLIGLEDGFAAVV